MKTYLHNDIISVKHGVDKIYISTHDNPFEGSEDAMVILLNEEIGAVIDALKRIQSDIRNQRREKTDREKLVAWNTAAVKTYAPKPAGAAERRE